MRPLFLVVEGIDGSGGTTQAGRLCEWLTAAGAPEVLRTREPSDGPVGRFIRRVLSAEGSEQELQGLGDTVLPYLFAGDRRDHLDRIVLPALARGAMVVSDRYYHSSLAYQSLSVGFELVAGLNAAFPAPDLTILLDLDPERSLERIEARGAPRDRFEDLERLQLVHEAYERVIAWCIARGEAVLRVDASRSREEVFATIAGRVGQLMRPV